LIRTFWKTLECIQNYSEIMIDLIELSKMNERLTFILRNIILGYKNYLKILKMVFLTELFLELM